MNKLSQICFWVCRGRHLEIKSFWDLKKSAYRLRRVCEFLVFFFEVRDLDTRAATKLNPKTGGKKVRILIEILGQIIKDTCFLCRDVPNGMSIREWNSRLQVYAEMKSYGMKKIWICQKSKKGSQWRFWWKMDDVRVGLDWHLGSVVCPHQVWKAQGCCGGWNLWIDGRRRGLKVDQGWVKCRASNNNRRVILRQRC